MTTTNVIGTKSGKLIIIPYSNEYEQLWDDFVMTKSVNGTFLQTRRFLNYHVPGKFHDVSLMVFDGQRLAAVCPANCIIENKKIFVSHMGATFGGLVISPKYYYAEKLIDLICIFDQYLKAQNYEKCILKTTPELFSKKSSSLLEYSLQYHGYESYAELNTYIDLTKPGDIKNYFDRNKNRNIKKCEQHDLIFKELISNQEICDFYELLCINLSKYNLKPIHTQKEILEFKNSRLKAETKFYGVYHNNIQMAGGMMFLFKQTSTIHAQNLSADYHFTEFSPITYLYYKVIEQAQKDGYQRLSWGISTENHGEILNFSLMRNKESYGSDYSLNRTFVKEF